MTWTNVYRFDTLAPMDDSNTGTLSAPAPADPSDAARAEHTRLRRRLLYSCHEQDVRRLLEQRLGTDRARAYGRPDLTANAYLGLWSQLAVMYNAEPDVLAPSSSASLVGMIADRGYWPLMQRVQRDTLGLREMGVRLDYDEVGRAVTWRPVFPDLVSAESEPRRPGVPVRVREWVECEGIWHLHDLSIREGATWYRVYDQRGNDITGTALGRTYEGAAYPYRDSAGTPFLPYVLYHAAETGCVFDPYTMREVVEGSLIVCVLLTFYGHVVQNTAWSQKYLFGVVPHGQRTVGSEDARRAEVTADPATVFTGDFADNVQTPLVGQWDSPIDPEALLRSIMMYERRLHLLANVQPADVTRQEADVRSGYSLAVSRESIREAQSVYEPQFRRGDQEMFRISACLMNRNAGTRYSEVASDYRLTYRGLPKAPGELDAEAAAIQTEQDAGRIGPITAYMRRYPGTTDAEALVKLADAATEREQLDAQIVAARRAAGLESPAQAINLEVGKAQAAQQMVVAVGLGQVPPDSAKAMLTYVYGIPESAAEMIIRPIAERVAQAENEASDNSTDGPADGPEDAAEEDA